MNTALDLTLFLLLQGALGIVVANLVSTAAGMTFSFLANSRFTFRASRPTSRQALLFVATTGTTMWVLQPLVIHLLLVLTEQVALAKLLAIGVSVVANFLAYRLVVWPLERAVAGPADGARPGD